MWKLIAICIVMAAMNTEAAQRNKKRSSSYAGSGAYAGGGNSGGYTGGYTGGNNDYDDYGTGFDYAPGFIDPYAFHQQLTAQILSQHAAQNNAITSTFSDGDASVTADASFMGNDNQIQNQIKRQHQQAYFDNIRRQNHYNSNKGYKANRYAPNYAAASGSIGPGGHYQSAFINPENPASPNIHNRFSSSSSSPGGYKGVSVSSFSSSSDNNGKRTSHRGAQTTINDNGKVTTYKVHS